MKKLKIVVGGYIGLYPTGGVSWDYLQYPLGLKLLGHEVYYIEDTCQYSKFQTSGKSWQDATDSIAYLKQTMEKFGFKDCWAYRDVASGNCFGLSLSEVNSICNTADVFINISASTFLRDEYLQIPTRVFIDSDPMFTQIEYFNEQQIGGKSDPYKMKYLLDNHTHHFTFGENINSSDCEIPKFNFNWIPTRQPVCLDYWKFATTPFKFNYFTSVMNWSVRPDLKYNNQNWGQKNIEFKKFVNLPKQLPDIEFEVLVTGINELTSNEFINGGWKIADPLQRVNSAEAYQDYIYNSNAEFSVAKETYIKSSSGWFSCRSACYLASGKPVITQDTAWSKYLPTGNGLFAIKDMNDAIESIKIVSKDLKKHSIAAREIANEYFDSSKLLTSLINQL